MCGIIGCVGVDDAVERVLNGLERLEYRGYDSAGLAVQNGNTVEVRKRAGEISDLRDSFVADLPRGDISIGHTRWSTHGPPTDINAHPHTSEDGDVAVVHNGIVSNHQTLRDRCERLGHRFESETDTEVIAHLVDHYWELGLSPEEAVKATVADLDGSYAIGVLMTGREEAFIARQGSPLVLGIDTGCYYFASDVPAFLEYTDQVVYLEDGDVVRVSPSAYEFIEGSGSEAGRPIETVTWDAEDAGKGRFDHYMQKEIVHQPTSLANTIEGRIRTNSPSIEFDSFPHGRYDEIEEIHLVACGTSYHAAMYGQRLLNARGLKAQAFRASTYSDVIPIDEHTLTIAVTQSGETADTLAALRTARRQGGDTFALTNVVGSTASREANTTIYIRAGPEIGVAATKTFSSQVVTLALLSELFAEEISAGRPRDDLENFIQAVDRLPQDVQTVLNETDLRSICQEYYDRESYFFIGHGVAYPVALEGALKFKEITYKHAEGYASGELKHGPLALVTDDVPIFAIVTGSGDEQTRINSSEAQARGAEIIMIGDRHSMDENADDVLEVPETHPDLTGLLANVQLQRIAYHSARLLERPIDKPRNLAKSVTVS